MIGKSGQGPRFFGPRVAFAAPAILVLLGLFWWWVADPGSQPGGDEVIMLQATPPPAARAKTGALALVEAQILETIGAPGTRLRDLRIVDQERLIVCGERAERGSAIFRRFVWLSQLRQVVTDDGGRDFAILLHVCNPPPPSRN